MAYWDNGDGTFVVHTFIVRYFDTYEPENCQGCTKKRFTDYTCGWNWARQKEFDWECGDKTNFCEIDVESEDVSHDEILPDDYWDSWEEE